MASSADNPSSASATTSIDPLDVSARTTPSRNSGWSSPTTTRTFSLVMKLASHSTGRFSPRSGDRRFILFNLRSPDIQSHHAAAVLSHRRRRRRKTPKVNGYRRTHMCPFARYLAILVGSAGIIGGAALGLSGAANAATADVRSPSIVATPSVTAHPAPDAHPGWRWHHGVHHLDSL